MVFSDLINYWQELIAPRKNLSDPDLFRQSRKKPCFRISFVIEGR
jgi:hypothetical protein